MKIRKSSYIILLRTSEGTVLFHPWAVNKFLLGIIGLGLNKWSGMLVGFIIGCVLDCRFIPKEKKAKEINLQLNYMMLGVYALQRSGGFSVIPIQEILRRFNRFLGPEFVGPRIRLLEDLSRQRIQVEAVCAQIEANTLPRVREWLLLQLSILTDHPKIGQTPRKIILQQIAERLGRGTKIPYSDAPPPPPRQPKPVRSNRQEFLYRQLECQPGDPYEKVRKAYYRLAKQHHPDRNDHSPMSVVKFRELKEAYEELKGLKGWK